MCNLICGLLEPTEGEIWVDGKPSTHTDRLRAISAAYADFVRYPLNVQRNVGFHREWSHEAQMLVQDIAERSGDKRLGRVTPMERSCREASGSVWQLPGQWRTPGG